MSNAVAFNDELGRARAIAAERKQAWDEAPELTAEEILAGFKHELLSISTPSFGKLYYYPMGAAEDYELRQMLDGSGGTTVRKMAQAIISRVCNSDGSKKFSAEHEDALMNAPPDDFFKIAAAVIGKGVVAAEKK